ncbi:efflux RND transporter periplasmic adaptor subunit [Solitalea canadensis]|uniref:RND family efflux transporter, MFP subunit n=1 Tax=Solitalea canadensis (strain ATCC 29591 / DSM 3403 / JCM 21819 / LMG 8368 / NBRC 15130 / NCIMB 12057 / USAM 9D) TaxID=929556 RepID=H8KSR8_SOLCM|nr:efflux RND transporter periplasmic adaptor subunit [Solitalea canadensis]AFD05212.1 RND family efflux transporter, MFP subunit [Solitalea canadensis DSM 3403]
MNRTLYVLLAATFISSACSNDKPSAKNNQEAKPMMNNFETIELKKDNPLVKLKLAGTLEADQETELYAKVNSYVQKINVDIGSTVTAGQVLIVLEAPEIQSQLASAKSKWMAQEAIYRATKSNYDRMFKANETEGAVAKDALDQITAKKLADEAQLASAKSVYLELQSIQNYLTIRAPFSGVITDRNVDLGAYVSPMGKGADKPLLVIQNVNKLRLSLSVPEANTPYLHLGDTVKFRVRSIPQKMYMAKITRKTGALDSKLRSEKIEADFINMNNTLKPLMVAEATIPLKNTEPTFFVPKTALLDANMGMYIIRVENGKTKKVPVTRGRMMADKVEVFGELMEGEQILVKGSEEIEDGTSIKK